MKTLVEQIDEMSWYYLTVLAKCQSVKCFLMKSCGTVLKTLVEQIHEMPLYFIDVSTLQCWPNVSRSNVFRLKVAELV